MKDFVGADFPSRVTRTRPGIIVNIVVDAEACVPATLGALAQTMCNVLEPAFLRPSELQKWFEA